MGGGVILFPKQESVVVYHLLPFCQKLKTFRLGVDIVEHGEIARNLVWFIK
jgi:hypothetical protein